MAAPNARITHLSVLANTSAAISVEFGVRRKRYVEMNGKFYLTAPLPSHGTGDQDKIHLLNRSTELMY